MMLLIGIRERLHGLSTPFRTVSGLDDSMNNADIARIGTHL